MISISPADAKFLIRWGRKAPDVHGEKRVVNVDWGFRVSVADLRVPDLVH